MDVDELIDELIEREGGYVSHPADKGGPTCFGITEAARRYLAPLIVGEAYPPFRNGLPDYVKLRNLTTPKKLAQEFTV